MIVTAALSYLLIGSLIWVALDVAGAAAGATTPARSITASVMMILLWPRAAKQFIRRFAQGRK